MINIARRFLDTGGAPNEAELATAVDRSYIAMYHALCQSNGRTLAGGPWQRRREEWSRVYMGMDENAIVARLRQYWPQASDEVKDFGAALAILQEHRDRAMEPPSSTFLPSEAARLIQGAESAIIALESLGQDERCSLAINLLVGNVHSKGPNIITAPFVGRTSIG